MPATGNKSYHPLSLSIRIHADGFSFFVCDPQSSSLVRGEHFRRTESIPLAQQLTQELCRPDYFNRQMDQAYVLLCSPSIHVPLEEFRRDEAAALYNFTMTETNQDAVRVAYTILPQLESVELYTIPRDIEDAILQFFPTARFFASRAMLMERLLHYDEDVKDDHNRLYMVPEAHGFSLFTFAQGHLRFANTFDASTTPDILYFVLNTWQTLGFDAKGDHLVICTSTDVTSEKKALEEYLMHIDVQTDEELFPLVPLAKEKEVPSDLKALLLNRL